MKIFDRKNIVSIETHFTLDGFVNKQNARIWEEENSPAFSEKSLHLLEFTVWCGFGDGGIIAQFSFEDENERVVTV